MNAVEIEEAISDLAMQPFVPEDFAYSFLEAFGNKSTTIKKLRSGTSNKSKITGGVLQRNNIHIAVCQQGKVESTLDLLRDSTETTKAKAKFILATDGSDFQAEDMTSGETIACKYPDFHDHFGFFLPLAGISTVKQIRENAFDIKATGRLNKLYIELLRHNPEWATADRRHDMNHFLARLIFCFFAEDTNIFSGDDLFTDTVKQMSKGDATNAHEIISELFRAMDTKRSEHDQNNIKSWAGKFPYVNGELFSGSTEVPIFTKIARSYLLHVGSLDWKQINPDIFGSMIQAVADDDERGNLGMHYTSVPNILKVLNPLFLDDLRAQLEEAGTNARKLLNLRKRIARIRVFDPACGSGNFLVIAYKELRKIENEINIRRGEEGRSSEIPLTNFRGIEIKDFSAEVARLALIIAEFQCDELYLGQQLALAEFLPLDAENWITKGNALTINWLSVCPPTGTGVKFTGVDLFSTPLKQAEIDFKNEGGETYICGNPPYVGATVKAPKGASPEVKQRIKKENDRRKSEMKTIFSHRTTTWKSLDYVAGWFMKAADYGRSTNAKSAFVSTNSICQGQQVAALWPIVYGTGHQIEFAHTSFKWANLAAHNAGVTVIIVGISNQSTNDRRLFSIGENDQTLEMKSENINAYLVPAPNVIIRKLSRPNANHAKMDYGSKPTDGGGLLMSYDDYKEVVAKSPDSTRFIRRFMGSRDSINGLLRYCLWIDNNEIEEAESIPEIARRMEVVQTSRLSSTKLATIKSAQIPHSFTEIRQVGTEVPICIPSHSSENREYLPFILGERGAIVSNSAFGFYDAPWWDVAIFASRLHLVWIATVCGKIKEDYRYSNTLGWNTFPFLPLTAKNKEDLTVCVEEIIIARERHFPSTIADLYDTVQMPSDLRRAHKRNDEVLERIYIGRRFKNDTERLEKLFELYTEMTTKAETV